MSTIASSNVPPPRSWDEFEDITLSAAKLRWGSTNFFRNGRQGQKQNGVDIWGGDDDNKHIGIQCKNTVDSLSLDIVRKEITNAEAFPSRLDHLYIATTAKRDSNLQREVRQVSRTRKSSGLFRVDILFWEDICSDLAIEEDIFFKHYPQFRAREDTSAKDHDKKLFAELTELLKSEGVIGFLNDTNMDGFSFREEALEPLRDFFYQWNTPERQFISPQLEQIRSALWRKVDEYYDLYATNTFPVPGRATLQHIPPEWEHDNPQRFRRAVDGLHSLAGEIVNLHRELLQTGKAVLLGSYDGA